MADSVDDFINRFGGSGAVSDADAHRALDRFASTAPQDAEFDNQHLHEGATEYLGKLPDDQFQQAAGSAFEQASPAQRQSLLGGVLGGLQGRGVDLSSLGGMLGMGGGQVDPNQMNGDQYARLLNYVRQQHPEVMGQVAQQNPWFVRALGNPVVMGILGIVASRIMRGRLGGR